MLRKYFGSPNRFVQYVLTSTVCLGALIAGSSASAGTEFGEYSAASCYSRTPVHISTVSGMLLNVSSSSNTVVCPAVNHRFASTIKNGSVWVYDSHPTQDITCVMRSRDAGGATFYKIVRSGGIGRQRLSFGAMNEWAFGSLFYSCTLPPSSWGRNSGIYNYWITEKY